ncbi:type II toxin-antitoxin system VapC family toxin [Leptospira bandrabouensis]|uniref:PIN domain-containing protein n=1 Tax=Leptospira bandrabouensis TaxID=2484903 RepID=A0A6H3NMV4_9LEPT|nr:PIN domain-containing protein [Leptospira bandrabouensis]MCG6153116.1 PIN domain-containing protein [Leptospira bandrabouensis]TGN06287.1 PIN domain-containing protein [Leptospira bandrabouensis]TGN11774.1 PIN domain-containing protein [Leptospira bandrabouensis]
MIKAIIDTGPIVAFFDESDNYCLQCRSFLKNFKGKLFTTLAVVTEVSYLLSDNKRIQKAFIEWIDNNAISILNQDNEQFSSILFYMEKYSDRPMDFADASLLTISEVYEIPNIFTLDSDFRFYKSKKGKSLKIINESMIKG